MVPARWTVPKPLWWLSALLAFCHAGLIWNYVDPRFVARPLPGGQVSIVRHIESLGPVWVIGFAVTGAALVLALWLQPRWLWVAHAAGAVMLAGYANAAWIGAFLSTPDAPIIAASFATTLTGAHLLAVWMATRTVR